MFCNAELSIRLTGEDASRLCKKIHAFPLALDLAPKST